MEVSVLVYGLASQVQHPLALGEINLFQSFIAPALLALEVGTADVQLNGEAQHVAFHYLGIVGGEGDIFCISADTECLALVHGGFLPDAGLCLAHVAADDDWMPDLLTVVLQLVVAVAERLVHAPSEVV